MAPEKGEGFSKKEHDCLQNNLPAGFKGQRSAVVRLVVLPCLAGGGDVFRHDDAIPHSGILPPAGACPRAGTERSIHHAR